MYGDLTAVDDVTLSIGEGECFGLLGPNGSGKTTLLSCIEGLKAIAHGRILVAGLNVAKDPRRVRRLLGVQLQDSSLFPDLSVEESIRLYSALYDRYLSRGQLKSLLGTFSLEDKARAKVSQLSGGQLQRLTLLLAIAHDPPIMLLDEPTTGLDPQARHHIWDLVGRFQENGKTIVLTTHSMEEAELLCSRVGIIDHGKIIALDDPPSLVAGMDACSILTGRVGVDEPSLEAVRALPEVRSAVYRRPLLTLETKDPEKVLSALHSRLGLRLDGIGVRRPNLEDVFLSLTGRELRES